MIMKDNERFAPLLGAAVIKNWGNLPQEIQQDLFEGAVAAGQSDASLRERLAIFLHREHPRTNAENR